MEDRTYYPLTPSQLSIFLSRKYSVHKSIINIPTSLIIKEEMDTDLLEEAVRKGIERWDSFAIRILKEKPAPKQYFSENREAETIERLDFTGKTREDMERTFLRLASKKLEIFNAPMARFFILTTPEGYGGIFSVINHLIMDSWAISMFYKDCIEIYYAMKNNTSFPKDVKPYEDMLKKEIMYKQTDQYQRALDYWTKEFTKEEPMFTHINGSEVIEKFRKKKGDETLRYSGSFYLRSTSGHDLYWIDKEDIDKMSEFLKEYKFPSLQVLFHMGLRTYLAKVNSQENDVCYYNIVARRGTLEEKSTGGTRVHFMHYRTIMPPETTFYDGCKILYDKQNELYRHADFSPMEMFEIEHSMTPSKPGFSYRSASLTFQPVPMSVGDGPEIETRWYTNGAVAQPFYLTVMDGDGTGGLKCYYEYMSNVITKDRVEDVHRYMTKVMLEGTRNPQITLQQLYDLY